MARRLLLLFLFLLSALVTHQADALGVNWGNLASHRLPDEAVLRMLKSANITKVKLFDSDPGFIRVFANTEIELMIGVPNEMLATIASDPKHAFEWVKANVSAHLPDVNIRYVAVGNEPFLTAYNASFDSVTLPALRSIQAALDGLKLKHPIKAVVPLNADVLSNGGSNLPSAGTFRPDIHSLMMSLVAFLDNRGSPFVVNIYPFLSMAQDPNFPREFAFFDETSATPILDSGKTYTNVFDASYDLLVSALRRNGFPNMSIIVGEVGWPTDGDINANTANAQRFNEGLLRHISSGKGTPLRPGQPIEVFLFSLMDEDQKTTLPGNFERHWGIFRYDGRPKYSLNALGMNMTNYTNDDVSYLPWKWCVLSPDADISKLGKNVDYACTYGDCTPLVYGGSCNKLGVQGNASYAFNSYFQIHNQDPEACGFDGLAMVTSVNPSLGECEFPVQLDPTSVSSARLTLGQPSSVLLLLLMALFYGVSF